jgi:hypothetical protein
MKKILFISLLLMAGCVSNTTGRQIDLGQLSSFKKGVTTEADIVQALGKPTAVSSKSDGSKVLMYYFSTVQAHGIIGLGGNVKSDSTTTTIMLDQGGKYSSHETTQSQYGSGLPEPSQTTATQ